MPSSSRCRTRWVRARARAHRHCRVVAHGVPLSSRHHARWVRVRARSRERRYRLVVVVVIVCRLVVIVVASSRRIVVVASSHEVGVRAQCCRVVAHGVPLSSRHRAKWVRARVRARVRECRCCCRCCRCRRVIASRHLVTSWVRVRERCRRLVVARGE